MHDPETCEIEGCNTCRRLEDMVTEEKRTDYEMLEKKVV